jgi:hypothetical protein
VRLILFLVGVYPHHHWAIRHQSGSCRWLFNEPQALDLNGNRFFDAVPKDIGLCLHLSSVPDSMAQHGSLVLFSAAGNRLSSDVPAWLGKLAAVQHLDLSDNAFTGSLLDSLRDLKALSYLSSSNNQYVRLRLRLHLWVQQARGAAPQRQQPERQRPGRSVPGCRRAQDAAVAEPLRQPPQSVAERAPRPAAAGDGSAPQPDAARPPERRVVWALAQRPVRNRRPAAATREEGARSGF